MVAGEVDMSMRFDGRSQEVRHLPRKKPRIATQSVWIVVPALGHGRRQRLTRVSWKDGFKLIESERLAIPMTDACQLNGLLASRVGLQNPARLENAEVGIRDHYRQVRDREA